MRKINFLYALFLLKLIFKKKSTIFFPIILFVSSIILTIIDSVVFKANNSIILYLLLFLELTLTVMFASIKALNLFKDLSKEGVEILLFSKEIKRNNLILIKLLTLIFIAFIWSFMFLMFNLYFAITYKTLFALYAFISPFFAFILFALISSLLALKLNSKIIVSSTLLSFIALTLAGNFAALNTTSSMNEMAKYLNLEYENYDSGTILDAEKFYLNNKQDNLYLIPKGVDNFNFSKRQKDFLKEAFNESKNSALSWQMISWVSFPYQFLNSFNKKDEDFFVDVIDKNQNNLKSYLYYSNLDSKENNYSISGKSNLLKLEIDNESKYIVPGLLKNSSKFNNLTNREIIYAREGADSFENSLPEDNSLFASSNNLVGKVKWENIEKILNSSKFKAFAHKFYNQKLLDSIKNKDQILNEISKVLDNEILDSSEIDPNVFKNSTSKKIHFTVALLYYVYFNLNDSKLMKTLLFDEKQKEYSLDSYKINIDNISYNIGGYSSFEPIQKEKNGDVIYRYDLKEGENFIFQTSNEIIEIKKENKVVHKGVFPLMWIAISIALFYLNFHFYRKKDYR